MSSYVFRNQKQTKKKKARLYFFVYTAILYLIAVGLAIGVDSLEAVFNIIGAISSNSIGILLPCFFYFKLKGM